MAYYAEAEFEKALTLANSGLTVHVYRDGDKFGRPGDRQGRGEMAPRLHKEERRRRILETACGNPGRRWGLIVRVGAEGIADSLRTTNPVNIKDEIRKSYIDSEA